MVVVEDFIVNVPRESGFIVGDLVKINRMVSFRQGYVLGNGVVVRVDQDPHQDLLPLFFVKGVQTQVESPLPLDSLEKIRHLLSRL
jgi:hypothetical protein